jgi:hypothetical protein
MPLGPTGQARKIMEGDRKIPGRGGGGALWHTMCKSRVGFVDRTGG